MSNPGADLFKTVSGRTPTAPAVPTGGGGNPGARLFKSVSGPTVPAAAAPAVSGGNAGAQLFHSITPPKPTAPPPAPAHHSGGLFGSLIHDATSVGHDISHGVSVAADKVAGTTEQLGTGLIQLGKDAVAPGNKVTWGQLAHDWNPVSWVHGNNPITGQQARQDPLARDVKGIGKQTVESVAHPGRNPVQTALTALTLASAGAGGLARVGYAAKALQAAKEASAVSKAGEAARAATGADRVFIAGPGNVDVSAADSGAGTFYKNAAKAVASPIHKVPTSARIINVPRLVTPEGEGPANLTHQPVELHASGNHLARASQAAHDALIQRSLDKGVTAAKPTRVARYANARVAGSEGEAGRIAQNLRAVQEKTVAAAGRGFDKGVSRKAGQLAIFLRSANVTGKEAADYWAGQAAKGVNPGRTGALAKLAQGLHDQGALKLTDGNVTVDAEKFPRLANADAATRAAQTAREQIINEHGLMTQEGLKQRLDLVAEKMGVGREGQGFTSLKTSEKRAPQSPVAVARGPVVGKVKGFITSKRATGAGVESGRIPDNTTLGVARALREAFRYQGTVDYRARVARLGSDVKRTGDDILVRDPNIKTEEPIGENVNQQLGRTRSTLDTISEKEHQNLLVGMRNKLEDAIPGLKDEFAADQEAGLGTRAPAGYKWVTKQLLPDSITKVGTAGRLEKAADAINSAVTSATVYLKVGHLPTRALTNFTTNVVQGSAAPTEIGKSVRVAQALTETEKRELAALTGTHGYEALPHEGATRAAKIATAGAGWWAKHVDAPFRINSVLYEFRQIGITTPEQVRSALAQLKDPTREGMSGAEISRLDGAVRRANRSAIMYDGLSDVEKRYVTRLMWFYPWTKAAVRYTGHVAVEHPAKALAGAGIANLGGQVQKQRLGQVPSYELGLTPLTGGSHPLTTDVSSFTPFGTVGQVAQMAAHPLSSTTGIASQLNPAYSGVAALAAGKGLQTAAGQVVQPTPEAQIGSAYLHPEGHGFFPQSDRYIFGKTPLSALARALGGAAFPRHANRNRLNIDAQREHERKREITIYG